MKIKQLVVWPPVVFKQLFSTPVVESTSDPTLVIHTIACLKADIETKSVIPMIKIKKGFSFHWSDASWIYSTNRNLFCYKNGLLDT